MNYIVSTVGFVLAGSAAPSLMSWQWAAAMAGCALAFIAGIMTARK